jgi:4-alpha-glucanotransferase
MRRRGSGILLPIPSLPSPFGIGDFGPEAYRFVDFLAQTKQSYWQILPLNPIDPAYDNSPYHSLSAFAFNPLFISPELMVSEGWLDKADIHIQKIPDFPKERVDYREVIDYKTRLFQLAYEKFQANKNKDEYQKFCQKNSRWLDDFALFVSTKDHFKGKVWNHWPESIKDRKSPATLDLKEELEEEVNKHKFLQFIFFQQWQALKNYCHQNMIHIIGDMPIYVDFDSVDVWAHPELFKLDQHKNPYAVAGVPPDYFSATGQLWGNPLYRWDVLQERQYDWWIQRMEQNLELFDMVRIDHFRGFVGYWEVPANQNTAIQGKWREAPAMDFFHHLLKRFPNLSLIAEDLGTITPDVREVMHYFGFPGMKVLLFAFGEDNPLHPYLPHTYEKNCLVYTGTHDNNTVKGWFENEASAEDKQRLFRYIGREVSGDDIHREFIRLAMKSVADTAIIPIQDVLNLGQGGRMNRPASSEGNWRWRLMPESLHPSHTKELLELTEVYGRT